MADSQPPTVAEFHPTITLLGSDSVASAPLPSELPQVPGYQIIRLIGRGGMGVVYEARDLSLQRTVALKMILVGQHASEKDRARFKQEAESVARLQHSGIVQIYEIGESVTGPFLALEYVAGGSLADKLDAKPWLAIHAAKLIEQVALAVDAAHQLGIVHRDLKPANILLNSELGIRNADSKPTVANAVETVQSAFRTPHSAIPKITDFGLAKRLDSDQGQTATGAILGTPSYMAPEQAESRREKVGPSTDVYALGAILYELLTGRPPFLAETPFDTIMQVCKQEPVPPARLNAKVPSDLETICLKCLRKEPERRYATAAELADDLRRYQEGRTILARPVGRIERGWRWCRRNPTVACLIASVATTLIAGTVIAIYFAVEAREQWRQAQANAAAAQANAAAAQKNLDEANAAKQLERATYYAARLGLSQNALRENRLPRLRELLHEMTSADGTEDHRSWEWHYLDRQTRMSRQSLRLPSFDGEPPLAISYSSRRAAYFIPIESPGEMDSKATLTIVELMTGQVVYSREVRSSPISLVALSANGRLVAWAEPDCVRVYDLTAKKEVLQHAVPLPDQTIYSLAIDGTGSQLALGLTGFVQLISLESKDVQRVDLGAPGQMPIIIEFDWSGNNLFAVRNTPGARFTDTNLDVVHIDCKKRTVRPTIGQLANSQTNALFTLSSDGRTLFVATGRRSIAVWNLVLQKQVGSINGVPDQLGAMAASHDGRLLALGRLSGAVSIHDVQDESAAPIVLRGHDKPAMWLSFFSSTELCSIGADGETRLWSANSPELTRLTNQSTVRTRSTVQPAFDAQGTRFAQLVVTPGSTGINNLEALVWDTSTMRVRMQRSLGVLLHELTAYGPPPGQVALSDNGKMFAVVANRQDDVEAFKAVAGLVPNVALRLGGSSRGRNVPNALLDAGIRQLTQEPDVVRVFDIDRQKETATIRLPEPAHQLLFCGDRGFVIATGNSWHLYDATGKRVAGSQVRTTPRDRLSDGAVTRAAVHPDGRRFAVARTVYFEQPQATSIEIRSVDLADKVVQVPFESADVVAPFNWLRFSPSGRYLIAQSEAGGVVTTRHSDMASRLTVWRFDDDGSVSKLWSDLQPSMRLGASISNGSLVSFDETRGLIAIGNIQRDQFSVVTVRRLETGELHRKFQLPSNTVQFTGFSGDGKRLIVVSNTFATEGHTGELHVFDLRTGQQLLELPLGNVLAFKGGSCHWSKDRLCIACWNDKTGEFRMLDGSPREGSIKESTPKLDNENRK